MQQKRATFIHFLLNSKEDSFRLSDGILIWHLKKAVWFWDEKNSLSWNSFCRVVQITILLMQSKQRNI